jgi:hypothetical protein
MRNYVYSYTVLFKGGRTLLKAVYDWGFQTRRFWSHNDFCANIFLPVLHYKSALQFVPPTVNRSIGQSSRRIPTTSPKFRFLWLFTHLRRGPSTPILILVDNFPKPHRWVLFQLWQESPSSYRIHDFFQGFFETWDSFSRKGNTSFWYDIAPSQRPPISEIDFSIF